MANNTKAFAINWWNKQNFQTKFFFVIEWLKAHNRDTTELHPDNMTDEDILSCCEFHNRLNK